MECETADLITQDSIASPLIFMPDRIIEMLRSKYLITPIHYEELLRKEPLELPEEGLRENLCNAIVHRNYMGIDTQMGELPYEVYDKKSWQYVKGKMKFNGDKVTYLK